MFCRPALLLLALITGCRNDGAPGASGDGSAAGWQDTTDTSTSSASCEGGAVWTHTLVPCNQTEGEQVALPGGWPVLVQAQQCTGNAEQECSAATVYVSADATSARVVCTLASAQEVQVSIVVPGSGC